ncbi:MAG: DUF2726 domain-containing protein [Proteobacteria bacterium]|nr:DUF2726 domain-containing protein [Pseudomonadota bacterium]
MALLALVAMQRLGAHEPAWPLEARPPLSREEQVLYWRLCEACPGYVVLSQVALAQLVEVLEPARRETVFNRYRRMVIDFVICTTDFRVVAAIELDDGRTTTPGRADANERKAAVLRAVEIPLLHFTNRELPTSGELRSLLVMPRELSGDAAPPPRRAIA